MLSRHTQKNELIFNLEAESKSRPITKDDVAAYTASMLAGLGQLAKGADLALLAYLLDMARLEAENKLN